MSMSRSASTQLISNLDARISGLMVDQNDHADQAGEREDGQLESDQEENALLNEDAGAVESGQMDVDH